ncbi:DUF805 domain-containing protein [Flagellimonas flava]|uniref:Uncharacterized membrane protein YhaH, DUF805 family n=1 Tax=Flagellimonas flava TaxID=570519 RepID=A0A1M5N5W7_9FLAO|nr:DUF805 domain-containing protein [Allomuricauda flava]SHG84855.1 Uncharacterized membrane protein YhaH, DUF805 family [Allomuricauda flava]
MKWYLKVLKQYADFKGRARRKEFWMFILFNMIFGTAAMVLDNIIGLSGEMPIGPVYGLYILGMILPNLAVTIRRLHDIGKKWTWIFVGLIPAIGGIWLLLLLVKDSEAGVNQFGPNPKLATE